MLAKLQAIEDKFEEMLASISGKKREEATLKKILGEDRILEEGAREDFERFKPNERFTLEHQKEIQDFVISKEKRLLTQDILICDRSIICPIIYTRANGDKKGSEFLYQRVIDWIRTYKKLFLLDPHEVPYQKDSVRNEALSFRMKVHDEYVAFLREKDIQYTLIKGSLKNRVSQIEKIVSSYARE